MSAVRHRVYSICDCSYNRENVNFRKNLVIQDPLSHRNKRFYEHALLRHALMNEFKIEIKQL